jgi:hypothetical protein
VSRIEGRGGVTGEYCRGRVGAADLIRFGCEEGEIDTLSREFVATENLSGVSLEIRVQSHFFASFPTTVAGNLNLVVTITVEP